VIYGFLLIASILFFPKGIYSYIKRALSPILVGSRGSRAKEEDRLAPLGIKKSQ